MSLDNESTKFGCAGQLLQASCTEYATSRFESLALGREVIERDRKLGIVGRNVGHRRQALCDQPQRFERPIERRFRRKIRDGEPSDVERGARDHQHPVITRRYFLVGDLFLQADNLRLRFRPRFLDRLEFRVRDAHRCRCHDFLRWPLPDR